MTFYDVYEVIYDALEEDIRQQLEDNKINTDGEEVINANVNRLIFKLADAVAEWFDDVEKEGGMPVPLK